MIDLDAIARTYDTRRWQSVVHMNGRLMAPKETPEDIAALVAELRAAREVVEAARKHLLLGRRDQDPVIARAINAYDKAVGP